MPFDPGSAQPVPFDPSSAQPFDPSSAAPTRAPGAIGLGMVGEMFNDLTHSGPATHDPNSLEQGVMNIADNPVVKGLRANYDQAVNTGIFAEPVRAGMEALGMYRQPGESNASLHQRYNQAIIHARQDAQQRDQASHVGSYGPNASIGDRAARFGQQTLNAAAGVAANPQYFLLPGMGIGNTVATRVGAAALGNAGVGGASDAAAQIMDQAEGVKKGFDVQQNLEAAATSGLFGAALHSAVEVTPFVKGLFSNRGVDTTPMSDPRTSNIAPQTTDHIALNASDHAQYQQLLHTGSVDDIKQFFQGRNGPQPSWQDVNTWVEHRDGATRTGPVQPELQPDFNYNDQYNQHADDQYREQNRQAVEDHVNQQMSGWKNAPQVETVHGPEGIADPEIRAQAIKDDPKGDALGFLGSDGKVRMFSGRITDPDTANAVLFHEGLGHFGLAEKFGDRLDQTVNSLLDRNVNQFSRQVDAWQKANPKAYGGDRTRAAEEVLAEASQNGQIKPSWKNAVTSAVKQFGRKMGLNLSYSDAEVQHVLAMSHDAVVNGKGSASENGFRGATQNPNKFMFTGPKATGFDPNSATAFTASDGQVRNEISDQHANIKMAMGTLGETLDHPELYEQYPELRNMKTRFRNLSEDGYDGYYHLGDEKSDPRIVLHSGLTDAELKSAALHEAQHAIQHIEGKLHPDNSTVELSSEDYAKDPLENEARETEARQHWMNEERAANPPKFMRRNAVGEEQTDTADLDEVDRLKTDPRFWSDPEFRANVIELARSQQPIDRSPPKSNIPALSGFASEAEARAAQNKFATRSQIQASQPGYKANDLEGIYKSLDENYVPTQRTWEEDRQAALEAGFNVSQIQKLKETSPGDLSVRLHRLQSAANLTDMKLSDLNSRLDTPDWREQDQADYIKAIADRSYLVARIKGERAELGRALNISKAAGSYSNGTMDSMRELLEQGGSGLAGLAADPTAFFKFARQLKQIMGTPGSNPKGTAAMLNGVNKPYWEQYLTTVHMNMMLSALSTHFKAPIDMATGISRNVIEKALAMPIGKIRQAFEAMTGKTPTPGVEPAEFANHMIGILRAVSDAEVYRASLQAAKTGESSYVTNGQRTPTQFANQFGAVSNPRIPGVSKMTDLISAQDTFFRSVEMNAQLETVAAREARDQLGPNASTTDLMTLGHSLATNPTPSMLKEAFGETNRTLLLNDNPLNTLINKARTYRPGMTKGERVMAFIASNLAPFIRVESNNLINRIIQRSPLGLVDPTGYTQAQLKMGGAKADIAMSKMIYGTALLGLYWGAADQAKKLLTGDGPSSVDKYKQAIASGWRPNAVHEDGKYNTGGQLGMSVNPFDLHNKTAQLVASARQAYEAGMSSQGWGSAFKMAMGSVFHNLADMSWVSDFQPVIDATMAHGTEGGSIVSNFASKTAGTFVPMGLGQTARLIDPNQRDTTSPGSISGAMGNEMASEVPGLREQLPIKYSVYGEPLANGQSLTGVHTIIPGLSGNGTTETHDPAERELDRLNSQWSHTLITPVQHSFKLNDDELDALDESPHKSNFAVDTEGHVKLTPAQFEELQRLAGRGTVETVRQDMSTPEWHSMSDAERVQHVRDIQTDMKAAAREALFKQ